MLLGVFDLEFFDIDAGDGPSFLAFFGLGEIPSMVPITIFTFSLWAGSLLSNYYVAQGDWLWVAVLFVPNLMFGLVLTHYVSLPLRRLFQHLEQDAVEHVDVVGNLCRITSGEANSEFGQAEVQIDGTTILVSVRTSNDEQLSKGDEAIVVEYARETHHYVVSGIDKEG